MLLNVILSICFVTFFSNKTLTSGRALLRVTKTNA